MPALGRPHFKRIDRTKARVVDLMRVPYSRYLADAAETDGYILRELFPVSGIVNKIRAQVDTLDYNNPKISASVGILTPGSDAARSWPFSLKQGLNLFEEDLEIQAGEKLVVWIRDWDDPKPIVRGIWIAFCLETTGDA